ncbi:hypothetical protein GJAV_G00138790 [Gymnothorax javanicus]|nr:hypothetical protein GJAV_G00138790 [Gymnothorax javanicus]
MVSTSTPYHFFLILTLIIRYTDAVRINAKRGSSVFLSCPSNLYADATVTVTWRKIGSLQMSCQYRVENGTFKNLINCDFHINKRKTPPTLRMTEVMSRDAGYYNCSVFKFMPPPTEKTFYQVNLHIEDAVRINAKRGSSVFLSCPSNLYADATVTVTWRKIGSLQIPCQYRVENGTFKNLINCDFHVNKRKTPPTLRMTEVMSRDAGYYNCSVFKFMPPPTEKTFYQVNLHIEGPPDITIEQQRSNISDCLMLLCKLEGLDSAQVNFTWSRNGERILETNNPLHLCKPAWSEGDIFTCRTNPSSNYTDLSANITIAKAHEALDDSKAIPWIIISVGVFVGTLVLIFLAVCIFKCKKHAQVGASIVYTNKVYENFSFSTAHQQKQRNASNLHEQCIYEN